MFEMTNENRATVEHMARIKEKIMLDWEVRVRGSIPAAQEKTKLILRNMLPELLDNLTVNLSSEGATAEYEKAGEIGKEHGKQRAEIVDYTLTQMIYEYRILRQVIFDTLEQERLHNPKVRNIIMNVIDEGIQNAVEQFAIVRARELEQSNKDLEHFAAIAAHDLKSPLATISGYMEILEEDLKDKIGPEDVDLVKAIKRSAAQMTLLIDRLLEYSSGGIKAGAFIRMSTNDIVKEVIENLKGPIEETGTKIFFKDLPQVQGEHSLLAQLFQNLISNAIKFRDEKRIPEIYIEAQDKPNEWLFSVRDNGLGFNPSDKENLFTLFAKVHSKASHKGSGIGLATARKIVELHGGRIWADSKPGDGATFFFTLAK